MSSQAEEFSSVGYKDVLLKAIPHVFTFLDVFESHSTFSLGRNTEVFNFQYFLCNPFVCFVILAVPSPAKVENKPDNATAQEAKLAWR